MTLNKWILYLDNLWWLPEGLKGELVTTETPLIGNTFLTLAIDLLSPKYFLI